jgi:hypothetical protein
MPLTRANVEAKLVGDWRQLLLAAGMAVVNDGTNADLNWPIATALLWLGVAPSNAAVVTDADIGRVPASRTPFFLALAGIHTAEAILGQVRALVDTQVGINRLSNEEMADGLEMTIARLWQQVQAQFVRGRSQVVSGPLVTDPQPPDAVAVPWVPPS